MPKEVINDQSKSEYIHNLYQTILEAGKNSVTALSELSSIAGGGFQEARDLIYQLEQQDGELSLPFPDAENVKTPLLPKKQPGIVWSKEDQQRMSEGKMPKSPPEHLNL